MINQRSILHSTRMISLTEGVSYLVLLFIAMPLKYFADLPIAVQYVGWAHGALFILLYSLLFLCFVRRTLSFWMCSIAAIAALLPFAPFILDRYLKNRQQAIPNNPS